MELEKAQYQTLSPLKGTDRRMLGLMELRKIQRGEGKGTNDNSDGQFNFPA